MLRPPMISIAKHHTTHQLLRGAENMEIVFLILTVRSLTPPPPPPPPATTTTTTTMTTTKQH
ncbi:hypothetical protein E2C01_002405 [Portunus trituberculatus]|uniref:Uncharacterized protein n=1 Tax=Portunus trituberculatus TaxID=210409 RepID=A0A5B7CJK9_PORTR|nr:hypothetical protein [Portunus trituberculatus]